jgi:hypothetical protein
MPCDSRVTSTTMTNSNRITEALVALGWTVSRTDLLSVHAAMKGRRLSFSRRREGDAFTTTDNIDVNAIQRKYSEIGVRAWAKTRGFSVVENDGKTMKLVNRRG